MKKTKNLTIKQYKQLHRLYDILINLAIMNFCCILILFSLYICNRNELTLLITGFCIAFAMLLLIGILIIREIRRKYRQKR